MIQEEVALLCRNIDKHHKSHEELELHGILLACTTDIVSRFTLAKSAGLQSDSAKSLDWHRTITAVARITPLVKQFPWTLDLIEYVPQPILRLVVPNLARLLHLHKVSFCLCSLKTDLS